MKLLIAIVAVFLVCASIASAASIQSFSTPEPITGRVPELPAGTTVTVLNRATGGVGTATTTEEKEFLVEMANYGGANNGHPLTISCNGCAEVNTTYADGMSITLSRDQRKTRNKTAIAIGIGAIAATGAGIYAFRRKKPEHKR